MATATQYRKVQSQVWNKEIDWNSDTIYAALLTASYTPNLDTDDYWNDISANEVANGNGYTTNGQLLTGCTITYTPANSWATTWVANTAYAADYVVRPTTGNGYLYRVKSAGTSHASVEPTWPTTIGGEVTDSGVTWECAGKGVTVLDANDPSWTSSNITARYIAIVDRSPGTDATRPLIALIDQGAAVTTVNGTWAATFDAQGILMWFAAK